MPDLKPQIFTDRREFLLAALSSDQKKWKGLVQLNDEQDSLRTVYGLANTEYQFRIELAKKFIVTGRMHKDELQHSVKVELSDLLKGIRDRTETPADAI